MKNEELIIRLLQENNILLRELLSYVKNNDGCDMQQFVINVAANLFVDSLTEESKDKIMSTFKGKLY